MARVVNPATRQFGRWWMVDQSKRRGLECELASQEFYRWAESPNFSPVVDFFAPRELVLFFGFQRCTRLRWPSVSLRLELVI